MKAKRTKYKGVQYKSFLEARTAFLLDKLKISFKYEKESYILKNGVSYIPDFFVGNHLLIECKGVITENQQLFHIEVAKELKKDILIISNTNSYFIDVTTSDEYIHSDRGFQYINCSNCKQKSFVTTLGQFHCRECGNWEGDHDIVYFFDYGTDEIYEELGLNKYKLDF